MTQIHYNMPPELLEYEAEHPAAAPGLCLVCLMNAKGEQVVATRDTWQPLAHDGDDSGPAAWMPYNVRSDIREAVIVGICDMFPGQLMPLCWDHLAAIAPANPLPLCRWCGGTGHKAGGLEAASGPLPPGLGGNGSHKRGRG
jgi:hypothetical protein